MGIASIKLLAKFREEIAQLPINGGTEELLAKINALIEKIQLGLDSKVEALQQGMHLLSDDYKEDIKARFAALKAPTPPKSGTDSSSLASYLNSLDAYLSSWLNITQELEQALKNVSLENLSRQQIVAKVVKAQPRNLANRPKFKAQIANYQLNDNNYAQEIAQLESNYWQSTPGGDSKILFQDIKAYQLITECWKLYVDREEIIANHTLESGNITDHLDKIHKELEAKIQEAQVTMAKYLPKALTTGNPVTFSKKPSTQPTTSKSKPINSKPKR